MCKKIINEPKDEELDPHAVNIHTNEEEDSDEGKSPEPRLSLIVRGQSVRRKKNEAIADEFLFEDLCDHDTNYKYEKSNASCRLDEITGFVFGGMTARFWMLRKHINLLDYRNAKLHAPFYCWECLTLQMGNVEVNLVIKNEYHMQNMLKFLISKLKTIDGTRDTALSVEKILYE